MQNYSLTFPTYFRVAQISLRHHNSAPYMIAQDGGNSQGFFCVSRDLAFIVFTCFIFIHFVFYVYKCFFLIAVTVMIISL